MNNVQLIGRATDEPKDIPANGIKIVGFTLGVDRPFKKEGQPTADFVNCKAFGRTAENIKKYMHKGHKYAVTAHIQTGRYKNKEDKWVYTTDIVVDTFEFCESKSSAESAPSDYQPRGDKAPEEHVVEVPKYVEEEIPFF